MPKITKHGGPTSALASPPEPTPVVPVVEPGQTIVVDLEPDAPPMIVVDQGATGNEEADPLPVDKTEPESGGEDIPSLGTNSSESSEKGEKKPPESVKKNPSPARSVASHSPRRRAGAAGSADSTDGRKAE